MKKTEKKSKKIKTYKKIYKNKEFKKVKTTKKIKKPQKQKKNDKTTKKWLCLAAIVCLFTGEICNTVMSVKIEYIREAGTIWEFENTEVSTNSEMGISETGWKCMGQTWNYCLQDGHSNVKSGLRWKSRNIWLTNKTRNKEIKMKNGNRCDVKNLKVIHWNGGGG